MKFTDGASFAKTVRGEVAKAHGVRPSQVKASFAMAPTVTQKLNTDMAKHSGFLKLVNIQGRSQKEGIALTIGRQGPNAMTNDTKAGSTRRLNQRKTMKENIYKMRKIHSDFVMHDDDVSDWSEFPSWQALYRQGHNQTINDDRQMAGFHGTHWVADSDPVTNPLRQDIGEGWLYLLKDRAPSQVIVDGSTAGEIKIGTAAGSDYANLDALVFDVLDGIPMHKRKPGMVAIIGSGLLAASEARYYAAQGETPSEKRQIQVAQVIGTYGGIPAITADFFPENGVFITHLKMNGQGMANLSIYFQKKSWKRSIQYKPEIESTVDWNSRHEAFHINDLQAAAALLPAKVIMTSAGNQEILPVPTNNYADY